MISRVLQKGSNATAPYHLQALEHATRSRGVDLVVINVAGPEEIVSAIDAAKTSGVGALNFLASPLFSVPGSRNNKIAAGSIGNPGLDVTPSRSLAMAVGPDILRRHQSGVVTKCLQLPTEMMRTNASFHAD